MKEITHSIGNIFSIIGIDTPTDVLTVQKIYLTGSTMSEILRADIDGDGYVSYIDGYLLTSYVDRQELSSSPTTTYPQPSTNAFLKVGTRFNVIKFKLERTFDQN